VFLFVKGLTGLPVNMAMLELLPAPVEPTQMTQDSLLLYRELARPRCRKGEESATLAPAIYTPRRRGAYHYSEEILRPFCTLLREGGVIG
jgi:hypothetical protein